LLEIAFNSWPNFDLKCSLFEHWKWKYRDNPQKEIYIILAEKNGSLVGCHHSIPTEIRNREKTIQTHQSSDLAVHPEFRRKGIARTLGTEIAKLVFNKGIKSKISFELNPSILRSNIISKYEILPQPVTIFTRIEDIDLYLTSFKKSNFLGKYGYKLLKFRNKIQKLSSTKKPEKKKRPNKINISDIERFDKRIDRFWNETCTHYEFIIERNRKYLNWRFCDERSGDFNIKIAETNQRILGYIIMKEKKENNEKENSTGYIADLLTLPERLDVAEELLSKGTEFLDEAGCNTIHSMIIKNHPFEKIFKNQGFLNSRLEVFVLFRFDQKKILNNHISPDSLHIQYGDTDWI
jgi:ribosomal protein S18 acetylase RimI-like enzyme